MCFLCTGLTEAQYNALDGNLQWYCAECKVPAIQAVKVDRSIEEKCKAYFDSFKIEFKEEINSQLNEIRQDISDIKRSQSSNTSTEVNVVATVKKVVQDSIKVQEQEQMERERRRNNLILFNASEVQTNVKDERITHDKATFKRICDAICDESLDREDIVEARRLGRKSEGSTRPLVIKLKDGLKKKAILKNASKISTLSDDSINTIRMNHDLTEKEREHSKQLFVEAKRREAQDNMGGYKYKVRGPPWDMRIVRVKTTQ